MEKEKPIYPVGTWVGMGLPIPAQDKFFNCVSKVTYDAANGNASFLNRLNEVIHSAELNVKAAA